MDQVFKSDLHYQEHTGVLTHKLTQPSEDIILNRNAELRKNKGVIKDLGAGSEGGTWGRMVATIPLNILEKAKREGYDLDSTDKDFASKELFRFLNTPIGKACMVQGD